MGTDRYNSGKQRLAKLSRLAKEPNSRMTSKQHKEMMLLRESIDVWKEDYSLEKTLKIISYLEDQRDLERATPTDIARLEILKIKHLIMLKALFPSKLTTRICLVQLLKMT